MTCDKRARIRALNDQLRTLRTGGTIMITAGVKARGGGFVEEALDQVSAFSTFTPANDPHEEHDFGLVTVRDEAVFWKIDYYDEGLSHAAEDPSDSDSCHRVMTIMLAEEY